MPAALRAAQWLAGFDTTAPGKTAVALHALQDPIRQDQVVCVPTIDLDVDSDNTATVARSSFEEAIEQVADKPGVIVPVGGDRAKMIVDVPAGRTATLAFDAGAAGRVKVFSSAGTVVLEQGRLSTPIVGGGSPQPFWIEAFAPSANMADIAFTLTATGTGTASSDKILATAVAVDLTIDDLPLDIEDGSGAVIWRNSDFTRHIQAPDARQTEPGVTRYLPDYTTVTAIDPAFESQFTKARATITAGMAAAYEFRFAIGDPAPVALWTKTQWDGFVAAADGWWRIPTDRNVRPKAIKDTTLDFWIEGLQSTGYAAGSIAFTALHTAIPTAARPTDVANFTVLDAGLGVDGNRDGTIDFADSFDRQLTFWLNDDRDVIDDPGLFGMFDWYDRWAGSPYETEDALFDTKDSADRAISTERDLEDFAAINFLADRSLIDRMIPTANATTAATMAIPNYRYELKVDRAGPQVRLFDDAESAPLDHVADRVISGRLKNRSTGQDIDRNGAALDNLRPSRSLSKPNEGERFRYLFEAFGTAGKAKLEYTVTVAYPVQVGTSGPPKTTSRTHTIDVDLRPITDFYTRMRVPYRMPADARYAAFSREDSVMPHFEDAAVRSGGQPAAMPFLKGDGTVVLVHGWNMTDGQQTNGPKTDWKKTFAETAFKRLYWQGFRGAFVAFDWPTFSDSEGSLSGQTVESFNFSYNASEFQAFRSGRSLMHFLEAQQAAGPVHLLAHSMGNVVAAEALRQWAVAGKAIPLVTSYVAMQGAISAGAYGDDSRDALENAFGSPTSTTDFYRYWSVGEAGQGSRFLMQGTDQAAGKWINMYNPVDAATSGGQAGWVANNLQKPIAGAIWRDFLVQPARRFAYRIDADGRLLRSYATATGQVLDEGTIDLKPWLVAKGQPELPGLAAYEIIAFMAKANAMPIGTKEVDRFGTNIDIRSLGLGEPYSREWSGHSFQFHFDAATTSQFWKRVVDETKMDTVSKPRNP
jgi:hypothetical protein